VSGRLLRANFATDPLSRFYATRSFGIDAGVSRDDAHVPFGGPGDLRISVMFRYRFRGLVTGSLFSSAFVSCDATLQIYVEEFDSMTCHGAGLVRHEVAIPFVLAAFHPS